MFRKSFSLAAMLFVIMAGFALTVSPAQAAPRPFVGVRHPGYYPHYYYPHYYYPHYRGAVITYPVPYYAPYPVPYYTYVPYYVPSNGGTSVNISSYVDPTASGVVAPASASAHITVRVPANAEVWFDGRETEATGSVREFYTPPLNPGTQYTYDVKARWKENGQVITQSQRVIVTAGSNSTVTFPI